MFKPQLALHLYKEREKKRTTVNEDAFLIFEKYDGWYGFKTVDSDPDNPQPIKSRRLREIPSLTDLSRSISLSEHVKRVELKGTLIFETLVKGMPVFKDLNGVLNRTKAPCQAEDAYIMVHDFIPEGAQTHSTMSRYNLAKQYVEQLNHPRVQLAPVITMGDADEVQRIAEGIWENSGEGAIGKRLGALYSQGKRNKDIIKVKMECTLEGIIIGIVEGQGKYTDTTGALQVQTKDGTVHEVSGMTDAERNVWYDDPNMVIGKVAELQAMQILANGSLREGRFKALRYDKSTSEID